MKKAILLLSVSIAIAQNHSLSFDGDDDRAELQSETFSGLESFTIEAWFYADGNQSNYSNILQQDRGVYIRYEEDFQRFVAAVFLNDVSYQIPTYDLYLNQWNHFALTYDGNVITFIVNDNIVGTETGSGTPFHSSNTIYLGNWQTSEGFDGNIDELRLWNYALTTENIQSNQGIWRFITLESICRCWFSNGRTNGYKLYS